MLVTTSGRDAVLEMIKAEGAYLYLEVSHPQSLESLNARSCELCRLVSITIDFPMNSESPGNPRSLDGNKSAARPKKSAANYSTLWTLA